MMQSSVYCCLMIILMTHRSLPVEQAILLYARITVRPPANSEVSTAQNLNPSINGRGNGFAYKEKF